MLDYLEVKRFYADKLREDTDCMGRVESAFYYTIKMAYLKGVTDGQKDAQGLADAEVGVVG